MLRFALVLAALLVSPPAVSARTWHINADGTGDAPTIQAGIDSTAVGDTVELACGTYYEHDVEIRHAISLRSATGLANCAIIDAGNQGSCIVAENISSGEVRFEGITIRNGRASNRSPWPSSGGGVALDRVASCSMLRCTVSGNYSGLRGGGVGAARSGFAASHCVFSDNVTGGPSWGTGGAIWGTGVGALTLTDCSILGNSAVSSGSSGGAIYWIDAPILIERCSFVGNVSTTRSGGMQVQSGGLIRDSVFRDNVASSTGGALRLHGHTTLERCPIIGNTSPAGAAVYCSGGGTLEVTNCTVVDNIGDGVALAHESSWSRELLNCVVAQNSGTGVSGTATGIQCTNIFGNGDDWGGGISEWLGMSGNVSLDPLFCDPGAGSFYLQWGSPCLPANSPDGCGLIGAYGFGGCNSISVTPESWARVKARYR